MEPIHVTKTYLPDRNKYDLLIDRIWDKGHVTNNGPLAQELTQKLKTHLDVRNLQWVNNGTTALQLAIHTLGLKGSILTTPFSYVATANSIIWEQCTPIFVDIDPNTFSLDATLLASNMRDDTVAIMAVHIYGYPCDIDVIHTFANKMKIPVIYDAAHTFGCKYRGKALSSYGDMSTISFHATKVYHTIEGGCVISNNSDHARQIKLATTHGHAFDEYIQVGMNGKNTEFHAAIGLLNLDFFEEVVSGRKRVFDFYFDNLKNSGLTIINPGMYEDFEYNYSYFPVLFNTETELLETIAHLNEEQIFPRRYFYPSLNTLKYLNPMPCPVSEDISKRILCLPLYHNLALSDAQKIVNAVSLVTV